MQIQANNQIKVWDPLVRIFHWVLALSFFLAYLSEDDLLTLHVWAGYTLGAAIIVRLMWGFIGTEHARFKDFVTPPKEAWRYLKDTLAFKARRYLGHNPAGGFMIVLMMVSLVITTVTGIAVYGAGEHAGPMASLFAGSGKSWEKFFEAVHEFFANLSMLLVFIHICGVALESLIHKENLVRSMINGLKRTN